MAGVKTTLTALRGYLQDNIKALNITGAIHGLPLLVLRER